MEYIEAKTILQKNYGAYNNWFGIDYNMNLYKGCSHGCIYCDSRSNCYNIENFDKVRIKKDCIKILEKELNKKRTKGVIGIGAMSDTYNPLEQKKEITRQSLELINKYGFGVSIDTKSNLVTRDIDLFNKINQKSSVIIKISITTADDNIARIIEPNVSSTSERLNAIKKLSDNNIYVGVLLNPILPYITDSEQNIKSIVKLAYENGAKFIYNYGGVTLRENQRDYFYNKLDINFKGIKELYITKFGNDYSCLPLNLNIFKILNDECNKYGILYKMKDIIADYRKKELYFMQDNQQLSFI